MFSKLRSLLSAAVRPLRARPALTGAILFFGVLLFVVTLAGVTGGAADPARNAYNPGMPAKRPAVETFSYSDLRDAIQQRKVKTATLKPAQFKVDVVLKDGAEHTVGYPPTDETLADELAAAGAQVEVDTDFARAGASRGAALMLLFGIFASIGVMIYLQRQQAKAAGGGADKQTKKAQQAGRAARRCASPTSPAATRPCRRPPSSSSSSRRPGATAGSAPRCRPA